MGKQRCFEQGVEIGRQCAMSIVRNLETFWSMIAICGMSEEEVNQQVEQMSSTVTEKRREEIRGMAQGAGVDFRELLTYNLLQQEVIPEGCTVFFGTGKASATGATIFGKNSDKGGNDNFTGENCYNCHEINVVSYFENEDGSHVIGVSAAGTTGIKMGMNSYGVAAGTNFGYSSETKRKVLSAKDKFAGDRAQIARDALSKKTALEAAQYTVTRLMEQPMATSGMLEFADADAVYIVENVYDHVAVKKVVDAVDCRSNYLVILDALNEPGDASCYCRYHRSKSLLKKAEGHVTADTLKAISMDHHDGTGSVGICRHTEGLNSSTQSAAIMEINREHPEKSVIHIALGKPCNAWRKEDGHISISMDMRKDEIPEEFLRGDAYIKYSTAEPLEK